MHLKMSLSGQTDAHQPPSLQLHLQIAYQCMSAIVKYPQLIRSIRPSTAETYQLDSVLQGDVRVHWETMLYQDSTAPLEKRNKIQT